MDFEEFKALLTKEVTEDQTLTEDQKKDLLSRVDVVKPLIDVMNKQTQKLQLNSAEKHALQYITGHSKPTKGMSASDYAALQLTAMSFVHEHKQEITELTDGVDGVSGQEVRLAFIVWLMDYEGLNNYMNGEQGIKADMLPGLYGKADPSIDDILDVVGFGNAVLLYKVYKANEVFKDDIEKDQTEHKQYRTRDKAHADGAIRKLPATMAVPTDKTFQYALSLYEGSKAHLQLLSNTDGLRFVNGHMYFEGTAKEISDVELQNLITKEGIQTIDLPSLRIFYSIILRQFQASGYKVLRDITSISIPDLAESFGLGSNVSKESADKLKIIAKNYHNIVGVIHGTRNGKPSNSFYPVLNFEGYNADTNVISFSSPWLNYVIKTAYKLSLRKIKKTGKPMIKKNGQPATRPTNSYLIHKDLAKERNKVAVENVVILVQLIEQAGGTKAHIQASTIVERNVQLQERLQDDKLHAARVLTRAFTKTWELLKTGTDLTETYKNIRVSTNSDLSNAVALSAISENDKQLIPTVKSLDTLTYYFTHDGKKKE